MVSVEESQSEGSRASKGRGICVRLSAYDHRILDHAARTILKTLDRVGALVSGPIPLPCKIRRVTVLRSPHVDKKSREQFQKRICRRAVYVSELSAQAAEVLMGLDLPAGVHVEERR